MSTVKRVNLVTCEVVFT